MRVMMLGESVALTTGFARVAQHAAAAFRRDGWEVAQIASGDGPPFCSTDVYREASIRPYFPGTDAGGINVFADSVEDFHPDALFCMCDPGRALDWLKISRQTNPSLPFAYYGVVEGSPVAEAYSKPFELADAAAATTEWGASALRNLWRLDVPWFWHGVDTDVFKPLDRGRRAEVRRLLGWEGHFVVGYVARNDPRKSQDRLLKAVRMLRDRGMNDLLIYLHCTPRAFRAPDLELMARYSGVADIVRFAPQDQLEVGEPEVNLVEKMGALDLHVFPSKVEGFGFPILEAMACGIPQAVTADGGAIEEVAGTTALKMPPHDWDTWFNGAQLALVAPATVADAITWARENPKLARESACKGRERAMLPAFSWANCEREIVELTERAIVARRERETEAAAEEAVASWS